MLWVFTSFLSFDESLLLQQTFCLIVKKTDMISKAGSRLNMMLFNWLGLSQAS